MRTEDMMEAYVFLLLWSFEQKGSWCYIGSWALEFHTHSPSASQLPPQVCSYSRAWWKCFGAGLGFHSVLFGWLEVVKCQPRSCC